MSGLCKDEQLAREGSVTNRVPNLEYFPRNLSSRSGLILLLGRRRGPEVTGSQQTSALHCVQCAVCSVQCAECSVPCAVCRVQCVVCSVQCAVCSIKLVSDQIMSNRCNCISHIPTYLYRLVHIQILEGKKHSGEIGSLSSFVANSSLSKSQSYDSQIYVFLTPGVCYQQYIQFVPALVTS